MSCPETGLHNGKSKMKIKFPENTKTVDNQQIVAMLLENGAFISIDYQLFMQIT